MEELFKINYEQKGDSHFLTFKPQYKCGFQPKEIEITPEQWDALRTGFMTAHNDKTGEVKLTYAK